MSNYSATSTHSLQSVKQADSLQWNPQSTYSLPSTPLTRAKSLMTLQELQPEGTLCVRELINTPQASEESQGYRAAPAGCQWQ